MIERFSSEVGQLISEQMASGQYASENELIERALRALRWREQEVAAIQVGLDDRKLVARFLRGSLTPSETSLAETKANPKPLDVW